MSWLRSAINRAAEVGGKNIGPNLSRTVRNVAQHAGHAVAGGAKLVQDRLVGRSVNSFQNAVKRLDEVALNARGAERVQALARWLAALKEIGRDIKLLSTGEEAIKVEDTPLSPSHDELASPRRASKILFYDLDGDGEPMNFREVFLRSNAIENIVTSMIHDAPVDEEINLLLEIFGLCLAGGKELHIAMISSIQDLAKAFSVFPEEIKNRRDDLLQYAREAVHGLKLNAELERVEAEIMILMQLIAEKQDAASLKEDTSAQEFPAAAVQSALGEIALLLTEGASKTKEILQLDVKLRDLLQRKRHLFASGDTQATRTEKVELLKNLSGSLKQAALEAERIISENRTQKEAALNYRVTKAQEVNEVEKGILGEVKMLEQKRVELEAQLKEVKAALAAATSRHINIQEEKEQFDEASTGIVAHLANKEQELTRSIANHNAEVGVLGTWINFLEDTWQLQSSFVQHEEKDVLDALDRLEERFLDTIVVNLSYRQEELNGLLKQLRSYCDGIRETERRRVEITELETGEKDSDIVRGKKKLQEQYLEAEGQVLSILRAVEVLKEEIQSFRSMTTGKNSDYEKKAMGALESIEQTRKEFESLQRPDLDIEAFRPIISQGSPKSNSSMRRANSVKYAGEKSIPAVAFADESTMGKGSEDVPKKEVNNENISGSSQEETAGWEFDELEEELVEAS